MKFYSIITQDIEQQLINLTQVTFENTDACNLNCRIMNSFHEQCSYVAMEMLMHGIPLVITDSTGLSEVVEPEKNGYKINLKENEDQIELPVEECTQYIIKTLQTDKAIWQKECRQNFETRYHLDVMHRQVLKLYTTL